MTKTSRIWDNVVPIPNYAILHIKSKDDPGSRIVERKAITLLVCKFPFILIQFIDANLN